MAGEHTATLTLRRPTEDPRGIPQGIDEPIPSGIWMVHELIEQHPALANWVEKGEPVSATSFRDVLVAASIFYSLPMNARITILEGAPVVEIDRNDTQESEQPIPEPSRHPLIALGLGALRIMWFALRHPGKAAWINHRTGEVCVAN